MKWMPWAASALAHPSLLPIALATFVSVAGPGGVAEIGRNMPSGSIVAVAPQNPAVLANEPSPALLVRVVHEQMSSSVGPVIDVLPPTAEEEVIAPSNEVSHTDEASIASDDSGQTVPTAEPVEQSPDSRSPPAVSNPTEQPADDPADNGAGGGDGDAGGAVDQPVDDDPPSSPPNDEGGAGEEPSDGGGGEQPSDEPGEGDTTGDPGEGTCDVPGNGRDKHDIEPGHDKNDDGVDDRCQPDERDSEEPDPECDVPGNEHDKHPVEPGHDKDGDGVDDRCQAGEGDNSSPADGVCDPTQQNGHGNDPAGETCDEKDDGKGSPGGDNVGSNGRKDDG